MLAKYLVSGYWAKAQYTLYDSLKIREIHASGRIPSQKRSLSKTPNNRCDYDLP